MLTREKQIADVMRSFGWSRMTASRHVCRREALLRASGFSPILPLHRVPSLAIARFSAIVPMHAGDAEVR